MELSREETVRALRICTGSKSLGSCSICLVYDNANCKRNLMWDALRYLTTDTTKKSASATDKQQIQTFTNPNNTPAANNIASVIDNHRMWERFEIIESMIRCADKARHKREGEK